jgi:phosphatidate cytidylyltransferase
MKKRLLTAGVLVFALLAIFALRIIPTYGIYIFDLSVGIIAIFCAIEAGKLLSARGYYINEMAVGLYPSLMFAGHIFSFFFNLGISYYFVIQLSLLLLGFLITFIINLFLKTKSYTKYKEEKKLSNLKASFKVSLKTFLIFLYPTTFLLGLMLINRIDLLGISGIQNFSGNLGWIGLLMTFLLPINTDTSAMFFGTMINGPKLCPKLSPKKTISGAVSAIILTSVISGALFYIFDAIAPLGQAFAYLGIKSYLFVLMGFLGSIVSQLGDIFESYLKRKANVKDSGNIFPGHGGFLDRLDSHIFCAPFVLIYLILIIVL